MTTPLTKIENGILNADWTLVCEGFNKLTGKKLTPPEPITMTLMSTFDAKKASKKELYSWLLDYIPLEPMKNYSVAELREMVGVYQLAEEAEQTEQMIPETPIKKDNGFTNPFKAGGDITLPNGGAFLDGFRYTSGKKKLLPIDTQKVVATLDPQLKNVGDPTNEYTPREAPRKSTLKCMKCSKRFEGYSHLGVEVDGELKALCPVCAESI